LKQRLLALAARHTQDRQVDFNVRSKSAFDKAYMNKLFNLGYSLGRAGYKWEKAPGWH
jgi:hypothetical protein